MDSGNTQDRIISNPEHYISSCGLESIDVIKAFTENLSGIEAVCTANIIKYACRWKKKNGVQDLKKIAEYANILIKHLESPKPNYWSFKSEPEIDECGLPSGIDIVDHNIHFETRSLAENTLCRMREVLDLYSCVSVADMYDIVGIEMDNIYANKYGWADLKDADIVRVRGGWVLKLPKPMPIN